MLRLSRTDSAKPKSYPQATRDRALPGGVEAMMERPGSTAHLQRMAERCRRVAKELSDDEARALVDIAERCEERLAEHARTRELVASEKD